MGTKANTATKYVRRNVIGKMTDSAFLLWLLVASIFMNGLLTWKLHVARMPENLAVTGVTLSPIAATDMDGKAHLITFQIGTTPTVLYVVRPGCVWCARNLANIRAVAKATSANFHFVGLAVDNPQLKEFVSQNDLGFPIYRIASYSAVRELTLCNTPQTIVVNSTGKVVKDWIGAFMGDQKQIESYFKVKLPGLLQVSEAQVLSSLKAPPTAKAGGER